MKAFSIRLSDIAKCPAGRLDVKHWREDGTCKCRKTKRHPDFVMIKAAGTYGAGKKVMKP